MGNSPQEIIQGQLWKINPSKMIAGPWPPASKELQGAVLDLDSEQLDTPNILAITDVDIGLIR